MTDPRQRRSRAEYIKGGYWWPWVWFAAWCAFLVKELWD